MLPMAEPAQIETRHRWLIGAFFGVVILPVLLAAAYLWILAEDQYASTVAFSVRKEEMDSSLDLLGGISKLSGSSTSDTDVLYEYIQSQDLVQNIDRDLDLKAMFGKAWPGDPVFAFDPSGTIEDLVDQWEDQVRVLYDAGTGIITVRVQAFTPEDATAIATAVFDRSSKLVNDISSIAREDMTRYTREELDRAVERLKQARQDLTAFRLRSRIVDPQADLQGQMGVLNTLQAQLAETLVELDLLRESVRENDPRVTQAERRIDAIRRRIEDERNKFTENANDPAAENYATLMAEFERLSVDLQFAEEAYRTALAAHDSAVAEAQRQSRYLAAHIRPTHAEKSEFPRRWMLLGLTGLFALLTWAVGALVYYSIRDRR